MPADALNYLFVANELNKTLSGGRLDKITMPENDEIILNIRAGGKNHNLVISANPTYPRIHLSSHALTNPMTAPSFLMHLRKHIGGACFASVQLVPYERIIVINLVSKNELGVSENKKLIAEIMGKYSNIILVDSDGIISDSIKHITLDTSSKRQVLSGLAYQLPPAQDKVDISHEQELRSLLAAFDGGRIDSYILKGMSGLAPATISEAVFSALGTKTLDKLDEEKIDKIIAALQNLYDENTLNPCIFLLGGARKDFSIRPYKTITENFEFYESISQAMDEYYFNLDRTRRLAERSHSLTTALKNAISRTEKKLADFSSRRAEAQNLEDDKLFGELIISNIYQIKQGMKSFEAENYYADPPTKIVIPLDENKTPQFNAQRYYKKYAKKKKTLEVLLGQIADAEKDLDYYDTILENFRLLTTLAEMNEIAEEMEDVGLIKKVSKGKKPPKKEKPTSPYATQFMGYTIIAGKNNIQNDRITKNAKSTDVWFHTQKIHGSHVLIENTGMEMPPLEVIKKAASIAAFNSKAFMSDNVPVDYTFAKFVSKPKGSPLGKAIYVNQRTIFVKPQKTDN